MYEVVRDNDNLCEQQRAVSDVLRALAHLEGLQPVLDAVVAAANRLCHGVSAGLWLADGELYRVAALIATPEQIELERANPHVPDAHSLTGRVLARRVPVHIPDVLADPDYRLASQPIAGYRAMVGVPVFSDVDLIGVLAVTRPVPGPFTDQEIRLLTTFANQASIAIANARLLDAVERQLEQQRAISDVLRAVARSEGLEPVLDAVVDAATRCATGTTARCTSSTGVLRVVHSTTAAGSSTYEQEHPHARDRTTAIGRVAVTGEVVHIPDTQRRSRIHVGGHEVHGVPGSARCPDRRRGRADRRDERRAHAPEPFVDEHIELVKTSPTRRR